MLGKLLKYDFKSMFRIFVPLWLALLAVSVVNHFTTRMTRLPGLLGTLPTVVFMILYVGLIIAVMVATVALIIMRFYNGLLKDEGYLMFTLPVKPWELVTSKCIAATVVSLISLVAAVISVVLIGADLSFVPDLIVDLQQALPYITSEMVLALVLIVVLVIAGVLAEITHVYASLALGHLAGRHRIAWAVLAYIAINTALSVLFVVFTFMASYFRWEVVLLPKDPLVTFNVVMAALIVICLVQVAAFFVITERILSKRLNLE